MASLRRQREEDKLAHRIKLYLQDDLFCSRCASNPSNILLMDCAHMPFCHDCVSHALYCPTCNTAIKQAVKITPVKTSYHDLLAKETKELWIKSHCIKCQKKRRNVLFLDCGHLLFCLDCVTDITECPVCLCTIQTKKEIFIGKYY